MKAFVPNAITLLNLILGSLAIIALLQSNFYLAATLLAGAALADFADGLVARWLGVSSEVGKELDSLADAVSFGLVPGMIFYILLALGGSDNPSSLLLSENIDWLAAPAFILSAFSILRLAKFNLDTRQTEDFIGLATPANTVFAIGLLFIYVEDAWGMRAFVSQPWFLYSCIILFSYLLNANLKMFSFKFRSFGWEGNKRRLIFAAISVALLVLFKIPALALIIVIYIFQNVLLRLTSTK